MGELWQLGKVYRCHSKDFGTHDLLCVQTPAPACEERCRAMEVFPDGRCRELLHFSSVRRDRVDKQWDSLLAYYTEAIAANAK